ncbi:MAG: S46 family peptidase, partial [Holophagales bacterium]|nr:S46 family peptidase [Holophagales bacterium]
ERAIGEFAFDAKRETTALAAALERSKTELGAKHPFVVSVLGSKSPQETAKTAIDGTRLVQPDARKALLEGGKESLNTSKDPLLAILLKLRDIQARVSKAQSDARAIVDEYAPRIAKARFAVYGKEIYPDATGTLRLTYGAVESYNANGTKIQPFTTFYGLYDRHIGWGGNAANAENGAWTLPEKWLTLKDKLNLETPLNFVHTVDTIGGNSGSPVLNTSGEIVGLLFDGNFEGLPSNYFYDEKLNRSVSVDMRAVIESLNKAYDASFLVEQMGR